MLLQDHYTVITGGSEGIGRAVARLFAANGSHLWLIGRNRDKLAQAQQELAVYGTNVFYTCADLGNYHELLEAGSVILKEWKAVDTLINNAGTAVFNLLSRVTETEYNRLFDLNVKAPLFLTKTLLPVLTKAEGNVINVSSYFANRILPGTASSVYSATKGAINSLTKALAVELGPYVRVNAIAPGTIDTVLVKANIENMLPEQQKAFRQHIQTNFAMKTIGRPEHIAEMALFLASAKAQWTTGAIFPVDGGLTAT